VQKSNPHLVEILAEIDETISILTDIIKVLPLPILLRADALQAREELAERRGVGKMEVVGYLGDAHRGGLQQEGGLHQQHLVDVVDDGAASDLTDDAGEIDGGD